VRGSGGYSVLLHDPRVALRDGSGRRFETRADLELSRESGGGHVARRGRMSRAPSLLPLRESAK
jgi:hypothetical protein